MTVKIMGGEAALDAVIPAAPEKKEPPVKPEMRPELTEKPVVFLPETQESDNIPSVRYTAGTARKSGFGGIVFAQLIITAAVGAGLWAACAVGFGQAGEICERLIKLFR